MLNYGPSFSSLHRLLRMTGLQLRFLVIVPAGNIMDSNIYNSVIAQKRFDSLLISA